MNVFNKIFPPKKYKLSDGTEVLENRSSMLVILPIFIILTYLSAEATDFSIKKLIQNFDQFNFIIAQIFKPNLNYLKRVIDPLLETIKMSLLGSFLGGVLSLPFAYIAASNMTKNSFANWLMKLIFSILRTIPTIVNALVATFIFGIGALAGTVAIFIYSFSYVGKLTFEQIENSNMGSFEALMSMGYTRPMAFIKAILPQILPTFISTLLYNFEGNVRYAAILGYVGAGGIGVLIKHNIGLRQYDNLGAVLLCILITIIIIENASLYFRKKMNWGYYEWSIKKTWTRT